MDRKLTDEQEVMFKQWLENYNKNVPYYNCQIDHIMTSLDISRDMAAACLVTSTPIYGISLNLIKMFEYYKRAHVKLHSWLEEHRKEYGDETDPGGEGGRGPEEGNDPSEESPPEGGQS